jgi:hypothetical protein
VDSVLKNTSAGVPSWKPITDIVAAVEVQIVDGEVAVDTSTGIYYFFVPSMLNGFNLTRAQAMVLIAGATGATTVQVRNITKYPSGDSLSSAVSIAPLETIGTPGTINTARDDVSTDDKIKLYVTGYSTTKPFGLIVILEFTLP